jgi:hypothetical protein
VFCRLCTEVGQFVRRIPRWRNGRTSALDKVSTENSDRTSRNRAQSNGTTPLLKQTDGTIHRHIRLIRLKPEVDPEQGDFAYDVAALQSYRAFHKLRQAGVILADIRFQVALPTPIATGLMNGSPKGRDRYVRAYERALLKALKSIPNAILHDDLSIQFDVCQEVLLFESYFPTREEDYRNLVFEQFSRLGAAVPSDVELGFHLAVARRGSAAIVAQERNRLG